VKKRTSVIEDQNKNTLWLDEKTMVESFNVSDDGLILVDENIGS
jgi:hypothetical protein